MERADLTMEDWIQETCLISAVTSGPTEPKIFQEAPPHPAKSLAYTLPKGRWYRRWSPWDGSTLATSEKEGYHPMEQDFVKPESLVGIERDLVKTGDRYNAPGLKTPKRGGRVTRIF